MNKKIFSILLSITIVVSIMGANGNYVLAADKKASSYMSSQTLDVNKVLIGLTKNEFNKKMASDVELSYYHKGAPNYVPEIISFNEDGCLMVNMDALGGGVSKGTNYYGIYTNKSLTNAYCAGTIDNSAVDLVIPVNMEDTVYLCVGHNSNDGYGWVNYVPASSIIKPNYCIENADGTYTFYLKNISKNIDYSSVCALEGTFTSAEAFRQYKNSEIIGTTINSGAKITLPKKGAYTLYTIVYMNDGSSMPFVFNIKTADYLKTSKVKIANPIAVYSGTKVIVGKADPNAVVSCTYLKKTYTATADDMGLYIIKLDKSLEKGKTFKIWQKRGKVSSAKKTVKVKE